MQGTRINPSLMDTDARNSLREIGKQLDRNQYPRAYNGGVVQPGDAAIVSSIPGEDIKNVTERQRRSAAGSWQGTTGRQRSASRPRPSGTATPLVNSGLREKYEAELKAVRSAYPDTTIWQQAEGMWLLTNSSVISGLGKKATFLTALPFSGSSIQKSWGFWTTPIFWQWIGPRHTNFPDGSICAFEPRDDTWRSGDSITRLLDLYTLWALRHEHLRVFDRWPGRQSVPWPYERLDELQDDESCGCSNSGEFYADCCKKNDQAQPRLKIYFDFMRFTQGHMIRKPPPEICEFVKNRKAPPSLLNTLTITEPEN